MTDDEKLVRNERAKLTAIWLNTLASGAIITGVLAPTIAVMFGFQAATLIHPLVLAGSGAVWLCVGIALHSIARWVLRRLRA